MKFENEKTLPRLKKSPMNTSNEANNERPEVFNRLICCTDLVQTEACYYDKCGIPFCSISLSAAISDKKGRPVNDTRTHYMKNV